MPRYRNRTQLHWLAAFAAALSPIPAGQAVAHHSFSMFDQTRQVAVSGTVTKYEFTNPHSFVELAVSQPGGKARRYVLEGPGISILKRLGWSRTSLKPGDVVTVTMFPLRDTNVAGGMLSTITLPSGAILNARYRG